MYQFQARFFITLLFITFLLHSGVTISAQDDLPAFKVVFTSPFDKPKEEWQEEFHKQFLAALEAHNTEIIVFEDDLTLEPTFIRVSYLEQIHLTAHHIDYDLQTVLGRMLRSYAPIIINQEQDELYTPVIKILIGIMASDCSSIMPDLKEVQNFINNKGDESQQDLMRNLMSYCAIMMSDYQLAFEYENLNQTFFNYPMLAWLKIKLGKPAEAFQYTDLMFDDIQNHNVEPGEIYSEEYATIDTLITRAHIYAELADFTNATNDLTEAIHALESGSSSSNGDDFKNMLVAQTFVLRGKVYLLRYEWENARADFNQAVELDPLYADAYFQRGILHYTMIERSEAVADFEEYLTLAPDGRYAEQAAKYIDSLKIEIEASGD